MQCTKFALYAGLFVALLAGCAGLQQSSSSEDKPKVAVLDIRRAKGAELDRVLQEALGQRYQLVAQDEYRQAARRVRARRMKRRHVRKVAAELGVEAVVYGKVVRRSRSRYALSLRVRDGKTGKIVEKLRFPVRRNRTLTDRNERRLQRKLAAVLEDIAPPPAEPAPARTREAEPDEATAVAERRTERRAKRRSDEPRPGERTDDGIEIEDDYVLIDKVRADGQVIDDEVPPGFPE